jgi:hypothetical protein
MGEQSNQGDDQPKDKSPRMTWCTALVLTSNRSGGSIPSRLKTEGSGAV